MTGGESKVYLTSTVPSTANPEWPDIVHVKFHNGQGQVLFLNYHYFTFDFP